MKRSVGVAGFVFLVGLLVVVTLVQDGDAGKTFKLPHYEVTFGSWPLMEVKSRGSLFRRAVGQKVRGGRNNGPGPGPSSGGYGPPGPGPNSGGYGPPGPVPSKIRYNPGPSSGGYSSGLRSGRYGPPPTPAKLLLMNPSANKGALHKHLQETLKHYAANKKPVNLKLPIIVRAPGPHPPPPPPGYQLGAPRGSDWKPGPPPFSGSGPYQAPRPNRLVSMLQNAASSGMFKNYGSAYTSPDFVPGPPMGHTHLTIEPDGTEVLTHVNGNVIPGVRDPALEGIEEKPSVPPVLKIGGPLPENYTIVFAERQVIGVKSPDLTDLSGNSSPGTSEYDAAINLGTKYEQGYGAKPKPTHPLVITTFQKRGDIHHVPEKLVEQDLPDTGLMSTTSIVFSTPNISAPLGGKNSPLFKAALEEKQKVLKSRKKEKPLDAQVKLLGRLFTKLQRLKPPVMRVPADEDEDDSHKEPGGWSSDDTDDGWKKVAKTKVDSPIMAVSIQTFSVPEVDSADPDIVESMAEFGTHDVEFAETDEVVGLMETLMKHGSSRVDLRDLGSNPDEINDNMLTWVRRHLQMTRDANKQAHTRGEEIANNQFKQYQTFVTPPFGSNGWGPGDAMPMDPKRGSRSMPNTMTQNIASFRGSG